MDDSDPEPPLRTNWEIAVTLECRCGRRAGAPMVFDLALDLAHQTGQSDARRSERYHQAAVRLPVRN